MGATSSKSASSSDEVVPFCAADGDFEAGQKGGGDSSDASLDASPPPNERGMMNKGNINANSNQQGDGTKRTHRLASSERVDENLETNSTMANECTNENGTKNASPFEKTSAATTRTKQDAGKKNNTGLGVGLENFGNTCYCNSVLQALYHCQPFKQLLLEYHATQTDSDANLLLSLGGLFTEMSKKEDKALTSSTKRVPVVEPKKFVSRLKKSHERFNSYEHQDAHEFLNYLLNECCEILERERDEVKDNYDSKRSSRTSDGGNSLGKGSSRVSNGSRLSTDEGSKAIPSVGLKKKAVNGREDNKSVTTKNGSGKHAESTNRSSIPNSGGISDAFNMRTKPPSNNEEKEKQTWIHEVFQGETVNETKCLWCENVTSRSESFLEISVEVKPNSSIQQCLSDFSASELLGGEDKFQCDSCSGLHEAHKRLLIRTAPSVLAIHLKRFKYVESVGRLQKLNHRVVFSRELKLPNLSDDSTSVDDLYCLFAVVVHIGSGPNHGHYVCFARTSGYKATGGGATERWVMFDDETVQDMSTEELESVFGSKGGPGEGEDGGSEHGYILFYQKARGEDEEEAFSEEEEFLT